MLEWIVAAFVLTAATPAATQAPLATPQLLGSARNPYRTLFPLPAAPVPAPDAARDTPRIVCGMRVIPADPNIDPRIRVSLPNNPPVHHTLRVLPPPVCTGK
jgi:hypothetical protein